MTAPCGAASSNNDWGMMMKLTAKVGAYSSVVGGSVHIHEANGRFAGQVMFMCQTDTLRDKGLQIAMSEAITVALNDLFAAGTEGSTP